MPARILIIEDNLTNLDLMSYLLGSFGHQVSSAADGESGLELAVHNEPDLIVCDVQLPKLNGFQIAERLKTLRKLRRTPLIAVTAYAMVGDREKLLAAGFDGYISKPIDPEKFIEQVQSYLPAEQRSAGPAAKPAAEGPAEIAAPRTTKARVLVVDDSPVNLDLMRTILEPSGFEVVTAEDVVSALSLARKLRPDLVISDVHMAHRTGFDLARTMKSDTELSSIPCIVISSTAVEPAARATAIAAGARLFILRPVEPEQLLLEVEGCLKVK